MPRVNVVAARLRQHRAELGETDRAEQRVQAAREPHGENTVRSTELAGDKAGRSQDADAERAADDHGQAEAEAEDAAKSRRRATALRLEGDKDDVDRVTDVARRMARAERFELDVARLPAIHDGLAVRGVLDFAARQVHDDRVRRVRVEAFARTDVHPRPEHRHALFSNSGTKLMPVNGASPGFDPGRRRRRALRERLDDDDRAASSPWRRNAASSVQIGAACFSVGASFEPDDDAGPVSDAAERACGGPIRATRALASATVARPTAGRAAETARGASRQARSAPANAGILMALSRWGAHLTSD